MNHAPTSADSQDASSGTMPLPSVLSITGDEFRQSYAVAQLAVKLCELKRAKAEHFEKQNLEPKNFLSDAWQLIEDARKHVLREQTAAEYLRQQGGSEEALRNVVRRTMDARYIPFEKLCDPERNKGDTGTIAGIPWKVFLSERGFDKLFWDYSRDIGEKLKEAASRGGPLKLTVQGEGVVWPQAEVKERAKLARDTVAWKKQVQQRLKSWKQAGGWLGDFLALADFRRERDNRAANLTRRKRKRKAAQRASR